MKAKYYVHINDEISRFVYVRVGEDGSYSVLGKDGASSRYSGYDANYLVKEIPGAIQRGLWKEIPESEAALL